MRTLTSSPTSSSPANAKTACLASASGSFRTKRPKPTPQAKSLFPNPPTAPHPASTASGRRQLFRYGYQSLVTPGSVYEYDLETRESTLLKQQEVPGGFDRTLYASERIHATAPDGVKVPVSLVYRRDKFLGARSSVNESGYDFSRAEAAPNKEGALAPAEKNPLYVYGYGSYGYALPLGFNSNRLSLLDRGVVIAYAHIRGGGDLGKALARRRQNARQAQHLHRLHRRHEHLTANGYGDPARVAIEGGSAGGLLMGAVTNLRPDLFRAVLSHVPFVDVMNTMLDASLPLTVPEYEEWGDPNQEQYFRYMLSYSPYDNLKPASYPAMLVKTSLNDSQVMYWEPAKYVAKLAHPQNRREPAPPRHQHGSRPRRRQRPLRLLEGDRLRLRLPPPRIEE